MPTPEFQALVQRNEKWFRGDITETEKTIRGIEKSLGVRLPESLAWLLKEYGYGKATGVLDLSESAKRTLYARDHFELPPQYIILRTDNKDLIVIDTEEETSPGEFAVYAEIDEEQLGPEIDLPPEARFDSFSEWIEYRLTDNPFASSDASMHDRLVTIATFGLASEAHVAKGRLAADGIRAALDSEATIQMDWTLTNAIGGVKLLVMERDAERALGILNGKVKNQAANDEESSDDWDAEDDEEFADDEDESAQEVAHRDEYDREEEPTRREEDAERAFRAAVLGLVFIPLQLYVIWLLLKVVSSDERLAPRERRRALIAAAISFSIFFGCIWLLAR